MVVDISFPEGYSVKDGIPGNSYIGDDYKLRYPTVDSMLDRIHTLGSGCLLYKRDLSRAYRQLCVDPGDYHLLGKGNFDVSPPFGLRTAALMCQRSTNAVSHILRNQGHEVINYIDDFDGAESPINATAAFESLGNPLNELGLQESVAKACAPATSMTFLGSEFDTVNMTIAVPIAKLTQIHEELSNWDNRSPCFHTELQSLIGLLSYVSNCVLLGRLFISCMLSTLRTFTTNHFHTRIGAEFCKDLLWWKTFLQDYNGVSIMHTQPWSPPDTVVCTDACLSGCGGVNGCIDQLSSYPFRFRT
ncbi:uncharacterized protein LOC144363611 [Saccoglossus kowalevskii]